MSVRVICFAVILACASAAQVSAPSIGYVRDRAGALRAVTGVAGAFVLGEVLVHDLRAASFDGESGCAETAESVLWIRDGVRRGSEHACPAAESLVEMDGDEAVIVASGVRVRVNEPVVAVERAGDEWVVLRSEQRLWLLRVARGKEALFVLPEAAE